MSDNIVSLAGRIKSGKLPPFPIAPGPNLDAVIAWQVLGKKVVPAKCGHWATDKGESIEPYSTDIAAAWTVVEHVRSLEANVPFSLGLLENQLWAASFIPDRILIPCLTAPHAICIAAYEFAQRNRTE